MSSKSNSHFLSASPVCLIMCPARHIVTAYRTFVTAISSSSSSKSTDMKCNRQVCKTRRADNGQVNGNSTALLDRTLFSDVP